MIPTELDDLFADAMQAERKHPSSPSRVVRNARPEAPKPISTLEKYSLPEYWEKGRVIALLHEETQTALGAFQEYVHKKEKGARKLIRLEEPAAIGVVEYVRGPAWLGANRERLHFAPQSWTAERQILLPDLFLSPFGVHAELVEVSVKLKFGGIYRTELLDHTTFHNPEGTMALTLPAGTNVYEVMDLEAKVNLRKELQ